MSAATSRCRRHRLHHAVRDHALDPYDWVGLGYSEAVRSPVLYLHPSALRAVRDRAPFSQQTATGHTIRRGARV